MVLQRIVDPPSCDIGGSNPSAPTIILEGCVLWWTSCLENRRSGNTRGSNPIPSAGLISQNMVRERSARAMRVEFSCPADR